MYPPAPNSPLHIALTDTFSSAVFFADFTAARARAWRGLRQDSGDPLAFARRVKAVYEALGVGLEGKTIVFSDALDVDRCIEIQAVRPLPIALDPGQFAHHDADLPRPPTRSCATSSASAAPRLASARS